MTNPLEELPKEIVMPKIVDETGDQVTPPPVPAALPLVLQLAQLGQLVKLRKSLEKAEFQGVVDPRTLSATDEIQHIALLYDWPFTPWICAYFINDGPNEVEIGINAPYDRFVINPAETITVNRAHADERINVIYYVCNPGETASIRVTGEY